MAMLTLSLIAAWLSHAVLPDNARQLWRLGYRVHLVREAKSAQGDLPRSRADIDRDLRQTLRSYATRSMSNTKEFIKELDIYITKHATDPDPEVQKTVKDFRRYKARDEAHLRWLQQILDASETDPIPIPK